MSTYSTYRNGWVLLAALLSLSCSGKKASGDGDVDPADAEDSSTEDAEPSDLADDVESDSPVGAYCGSRCRQVSFTDDDIVVYDVWDNTIVYATLRTQEIGLIDLTDGEERSIAECISGPYALCKDIEIYRDHVYYVQGIREDSYLEYHVWKYGIEDESREIIHRITCTNMSCGPMGFNVWGKYMVWMDCRDGTEISGWKLYLLDMESSVERDIGGTEYGNVLHVDIWDYNVVFTDRTTGDLEVILYNITEESFTNISTNPYDQYMPAIWEDRVAWVDSRTEQAEGLGSYSNPYNPDVYMKHLGGSSVPVETEGSIQRSPDIYGDIVAWDDERNDTTPNRFDTHAGLRLEVYTYNTGTGERIWVTEEKGETGGSFPIVWGTKVFYRGFDSRGINSIFVFEL